MTDQNYTAPEIPGLSTQNKAAPFWAIFAGILAFSIFLLLGLATLYASNPNEDAFILFKYVNNLAAGQGIVFFPGGPHTEGGTDFLWLIVLAGLRVLGIDTALAAVFLNATGAGLIAYLLALLSCNCSARTTMWLSGLFAVSVPFMGAAQAAQQGFSVLFYCGFMLLALRAVMEQQRLVTAPLLALIVALIRPDGVIIGGTLTGIALFRVWRLPQKTLFLRTLAAATIIGLIYFAFRFIYFAHLLPLPLYVKSVGAVVDEIRITPGLVVPVFYGLLKNREWLLDASGPLPVLAGGITAWLVLGRPKILSSWPLVCLLPAGLLFLSLIPVHQAQNIDLRFQGPIFFSLVYVVFSLVLNMIARFPADTFRKHLSVMILSAGLLLPVMNGGFLALTAMTASSYVEAFANSAGNILDERHVLALTEAGRYSYWWRGPIYDLGGLNNADTAFRPATADYVAALSPDIVMARVGKSEKKNAFVPPNQVMEIAAGSIPDFLGGNTAKLAAKMPNAYSIYIPVPAFASAAAASFMARGGDYRIFGVIDDDAVHLIAIRSSLTQFDALLQALHASVTLTGHRSYAELNNFPGCRSAAVIAFKEGVFALVDFMQNLRKRA